MVHLIHPADPHIADRVINGEFGNGQERIDKLTAAGYNYQDVQNTVNKKLMGRKGYGGYTIHDLLDRYNMSIQGATEDQVTQLANEYNVNIPSISRDRLEILITNARMAALVSGYINKSYQEVIRMNFNDVKELYREYSGMMNIPNGVSSSYWTN